MACVYCAEIVLCCDYLIICAFDRKRLESRKQERNEKRSNPSKAMASIKFKDAENKR